MTTLDIELAVSNYLDVRANLIIPNIHWGFGIHECDLLCMSSSGYLKEIEIKISASDLKRDHLKEHNHEDTRIKSLFFAIPEELLKYINYIPDRAGILVISNINGRHRVKILREAEINRLATPLSIEDQYKLARLGALRIWSLKKKIKKINEIKEIQNETNC